MRSILSGGKTLLFLLSLVCFACGGGGGGGGGTSTLAELTAEIEIPNPGETATVLLEILSDGTVNWAAAVPPDIVAVVTGLTINLGSDASVFADLLGAGTFDPVTGTASGTVTLTPANAALLANDPEDYLATLLTSTKPPASGGFIVFTAAEWHAVLLGSNESPVADADARGAATFRVTSPTSITYAIAMVDPVQADINLAHIHVGDQGVNGLIVLDLQPNSATRDPATGTISGTVAVDGETLARIAANLGGFYCNVHTAAAPNGVARGQLGDDTIEMMAALLGSAEVPTVVEADARGGATLEWETLTSGRVLMALHSAVEDVDDILMAHIHVGPSGTPGPILVSLMNADFETSPGSISAEGTFTNTQADVTRFLANPAGFYVNIHTTAGPNGLVRGQMSQEPRTVIASLSGANESPVVPGTSGTIRVIFTGPHACTYTITMTSPAAGTLNGAHIHDGPQGAGEGTVLVDLFQSGDALVSGSTVSGSAAVSGRTVARILAGTPGGSALAGGALPSIFYGDVHDPAHPNGAARGQLQQVSGDLPPSGLAYTSPVTYLTGAPITPNNPSSTGGAIDNYSVVPPLPAGLTINSMTGVISGTPTAATAAQNYTVTASNAGGSTPAIVNITVNVGPPLSLSYTTPVGYIVGTAITPNTPTSTGGAITSYSVAPPLPAGLNLSATTGVISGTPTVAAAAANYTVTGDNAAPGNITAIVNITVTSTATAPSNLTYTTPVSYPTGSAITNNVPTVQGTTPMTFSVNPALPAGLSLDGSTGVISGTPTTVTASASYTVTATNSVNSTTAAVSITITLGAPGPFTYTPSSTIIGYIGTPITSISPSHTGGGAVSSYSISGTLLAGLTFNTTTGVISGTPTAKTPDANMDGIPDAVNHTVTATNATNSTTTTVTVIGY